MPPGSPPRNDEVYQIGFGSKQNDLTPRKAASTLPNVLFLNNGYFGIRKQFAAWRAKKRGEWRATRAEKGGEWDGNPAGGAHLV